MSLSHYKPSRFVWLCVVVLPLLLPSALPQSLNCEPTVFAQNTSSYLSNFNAATSIADDLAVVGYGWTSADLPSDEPTPGVVVLYEYASNTSSWSETQRFQGSQSSNQEAFGFAVAITDRIFDGVAFIGIPTDQRVLVIAKNPTSGMWEEIQNLTTSSASVKKTVKRSDIFIDDIEGFGSSLAVGVASPKAGSKLQVLVVGAPNSFNNLGASFVFVNSSDSWPPNFVLAQTLVAPSVSSPQGASTYCSMFGASVAVANSGTNIVVGAPSSDRAEASGCAFIFSRYVAPPPNSTKPPSNTWQLMYSLPSFVGLYGTPGDLFGASVGTWGSTYEDAMSIYNEQGAIVGIPGRNAAYIFNINSYQPFYNITYNQTLFDPRLSQPTNTRRINKGVVDTQPSVPFGYGWSVASNNNYPGGCILPVVGSPILRDATVEDKQMMKMVDDELAITTVPPPPTGAVYSYMYEGQYGNPWLLDTNITAPISFAQAESFGQSISVSSGTVLIGGVGAVAFWCSGVICSQVLQQKMKILHNKKRWERSLQR
eukprot:TRINITY_DN8984_c0_g1_i1.p1 TRINITY_DN8984_c0_g1~~TRINITY_DN8984_c0_g1_i1.p1  ORF type:complete len:539 (-),score=84.97 TRINITY_DN8984_c0_g1_i1:16-1632(-)